MRNIANRLLFAIVFSLALTSCGESSTPTPTATDAAYEPTTTSPPTNIPTATPTIHPPTLTPALPIGKTFIITSAEDSGSGTLREAMQEVAPGDIITFDGSVFSISNPQTIYLRSTLPAMEQGYVTIDAEAAGVILDGSQFPEGWDSALAIQSDSNIVRGLTLLNFSGAALQISGGQNNLIESNVIGKSDYGIGVWGANASGNIITANQLGVMADGVTPLGNKTAGIVVMEEAHDNLIGPGNQIAFNGHSGVDIYLPGTVGNTIFKNNIHDNRGAGIALMSGGNNDILPPVLTGLDNEMGKISGMACPNCEVLIYSDAGDEGAVFEGQTSADENGAFAFEKGSPFSGQFLTATATDPQGNTSGFSLPAITIQLQSGNDQPRTWLVTKPAVDLEDNRLGAIFSDFWQPMGDLRAWTDREITPAGLKLARITMNQPEYYSNEQSGVLLYWDKPELYILPEFDSYVNQLVSNDITIYYTLTFWDKVNHPGGWEVANRFETEEDIAHYLEYVRFIVNHFKGRVAYYELWNEPDVDYPLQHIEPEDYINLAKQAIPLIKEIDPQAKVVVGSTSGTDNPRSREYLFKILNSELVQIADVVSWHPLYDKMPDSEQDPDYYANYSSLLADIMDTARKNGFQGEFIAGEISYGSDRCGGCDVVDPAYTETVKAKYTARGIILHFGNDVAVSLAGMSSLRPIHFNTIRYIANVFSGVVAEEFAVEIQTEAQNIKALTFAGADGSQLIALWTDGVAVEDDPGIPSTITLPGFWGWKATGIDILNGFEQGLITTDENGNLIVRDFLIKDYPIIIRLSK